jgi:hypothetical protein
MSRRFRLSSGFDRVLVEEHGLPEAKPRFECLQAYPALHRKSCVYAGACQLSGAFNISATVKTDLAVTEETSASVRRNKRTWRVA